MAQHFFIKKDSTLPILTMKVVNDGRYDYKKIFDRLENAAITFSMVDEKGNYTDSCPSYIKYGIICPCGARNDWVYNSKQKFKQHISGVKHKKWIAQMNNNKLNIIWSTSSYSS